MPSFSQRLRLTPIAVVVVLVALIAALGAFAAVRLNSGYSDGHPQVVKLASSDLSVVARKTYILDCGRQPVVRPALFSMTCGDENVGVEHLKWAGWGGVEATSTARYYENTCEPYCAAGNYLYLPATVVAHGLKRKAGSAVYTLVTVTFPQKAPSWVKGHSVTINVAEKNG